MLGNAVQDASGSRGASCLVAAGEEAALPAVPYQLGYAIRDVGVDFQVISLFRAARCFICIALRGADVDLKPCKAA